MRDSAAHVARRPGSTSRIVPGKEATRLPEPYHHLSRSCVW